MFYPVNLRIGGELALVVGGGPLALHKARTLRRAGAQVRVISPSFTPGFRRLKVERVTRRFRAADCTGAILVISATDDSAVNRSVYRACRRRGIPVNVVDQPELCTFYTPSVIRRGPLTLSISTEGSSPSLSKAIRKELERLYPAAIGRLVTELGRARNRILREEPPSRTRTRRLKALVNGFTLDRARKVK